MPPLLPRSCRPIAQITRRPSFFFFFPLFFLNSSSPSYSTLPIWPSPITSPLLIDITQLKISAHPSLITNPQTPKTHLSDRQPCTDEYRLSSDLNNRPQAMPQRRCHLDRSLASLSRRHHLRPILFLTHPRPISLPSLKTDLSFPQSLNFSI